MALWEFRGPERRLKTPCWSCGIRRGKRTRRLREKKRTLGGVEPTTPSATGGTAFNRKAGERTPKTIATVGKLWRAKGVSGWVKKRKRRKRVGGVQKSLLTIFNLRGTRDSQNK